METLGNMRESFSVPILRDGFFIPPARLESPNSISGRRPFYEL